MNKNETKHLFLIIVIFVAACMETDIFLPTLPDMMSHFGVSESAIQKLLTWNFIGICLAGPFYGPLSDSFGRKKPLLTALGFFLAGSLITLFASHFEWMLYGRFLQGVGSGGCFTLGTAIVFDAFQAKKAVQAINRLNSIIPCLIAGAPLAGGYLNHVYGFRANFLAIAFFVLLSCVISVVFFKETHPKEKRLPFEIKKIGIDFKRAALCLPFWQLTLIVTLLFAGYLVFLSGTAVLFVVDYGVSKTVFPLFQGALLGSWVIASLMCDAAVAKWGQAKVKQIGMYGVLFGGAVLVAITCLAPRDPYLLTLAMVIYSFGSNWAQGLYFPEAMEFLPDIKGITASLLTSVRLLLTALFIALAAAFYDGTIYPLSIVVLGIIATTFSLVLIYEGKIKKRAITT